MYLLFRISVKIDRESVEDHEMQNTVKLKKHKNRVDWQVSILTAAIVIVSCSLIFIINYQLSYHNMIVTLQTRASTIRDYLEDELTSEMFSELNVMSDDESELYKIAKDKLENIRKVTSVRYLYTAKKTAEGDFIYLVDGLPSDSEDFRYVGDLIEPECIPDLQKALDGNTVLPDVINHTTWGNVFISYFPIRENNEIVGVLGIEFDANHQYESFKAMRIITPVVILLACIIAAFIATKQFKRISNPTYKDLANTDFLTGLKNRNALTVDLNNIELSKDKQSICVMMLDLDGLKYVNDTYGHSIGDQYIKRCCELIHSCIPEDSTIYRMGGDEFIVVLQGYNETDMNAMIHAILNKVKKENENQIYTFSISIGSAYYNDEDTTIMDTIKRADKVMYEYKKMHKSNQKDESV